VSEYDLHPEDFGPGEFPEVIILKGKKGGFVTSMSIDNFAPRVSNQFQYKP
jgi:hypothetical protein